MWPLNLNMNMSLINGRTANKHTECILLFFRQTDQVEFRQKIDQYYHIIAFCFGWNDVTWGDIITVGDIICHILKLKSVDWVTETTIAYVQLLSASQRDRYDDIVCFLDFD